jgi:transposase
MKQSSSFRRSPKAGGKGTTKASISKAFGSIPRCRVTIEVGTHSPWVSRLLRGFDHEVVIANPRQVKLISASSRKDDRVDAQTLARLARVDPRLLRPIQHRSRKAQQDLMVIRVRAALVEARTDLINTHEDWLNPSASGCRCATPTRWGPLCGPAAKTK